MTFQAGNGARLALVFAWKESRQALSAPLL